MKRREFLKFTAVSATAVVLGMPMVAKANGYGLIVSDMDISVSEDIVQYVFDKTMHEDYDCDAKLMYPETMVGYNEVIVQGPSISDWKRGFTQEMHTLPSYHVK